MSIAFVFSNVDADAYLSVELYGEVDSGSSSDLVQGTVEIDYDGTGDIVKRFSDDGGSTWTVLDDDETEKSETGSFDVYEDEWDHVFSKAEIFGAQAYVNGAFPVNEDAGGAFQTLTIVP